MRQIKQINKQLTKPATRPDELTNAKLLKNTINNENNEIFNELVHEYDRRLDEQVKLAKADMLSELEIQIKVSKIEMCPPVGVPGRCWPIITIHVDPRRYTIAVELKSFILFERFVWVIEMIRMSVEAAMIKILLEIPKERNKQRDLLIYQI